jgi:hypothetical protein
MKQNVLVRESVAAKNQASIDKGWRVKSAEVITSSALLTNLQSKSQKIIEVEHNGVFKQDV